MKMSRWTVGVKLWTLTSFVLLDVVLVGWLESRSSAAIVRQLRDIADLQLPAVQNMTMLDMRHDGLRAVVLEGLLAAKEGDFNRARSARTELEEFVEAMNRHLSSLTSIGIRAETRRAVEDVRPGVRKYMEAGKDLLNLVCDQKTAEARAELPEFMKSFESLEVQLGSLGERIAMDAKQSRQAAEDLASEASLMNTLLLSGGVLFGLVASLIVVGGHVRSLKEIVTHVTNEAFQVAEGAVKINNASQNLSQAAVEQASAIEETVASMEQMAATIGKTAENAGKSYSVSEKGQDEASKGKQVIARMLTAMEGIEDSNSKLQSLVQMIHEIEDKTQIINDIVFETRLLSFNASIEAARAGVHGKGFSVVAEEVGKLAVLSGKAADEIRKLLESSTTEVAKVVRSTQERVLAGKNAFRDCEEAFCGMGDTLQRIRDSVEQIATATQQQEIGVKQTNKAMASIDQATLNNSRSAETLSLLAVELERGSEGLKGSVASLRAMVQGDGWNSAERLSRGESPGRKRVEDDHSSASARGFSEPAHAGDVPRNDPPASPIGGDGSVSRFDSRWQKAESGKA